MRGQEGKQPTLYKVVPPQTGEPSGPPGRDNNPDAWAVRKRGGRNGMETSCNK